MSELPENLEHFTAEVKGSASMLEDLYLRRLRDPENEFLRDEMLHQLERLKSAIDITHKIVKRDIQSSGIRRG